MHRGCVERMRTTVGLKKQQPITRRVTSRHPHAHPRPVAAVAAAAAGRWSAAVGARDIKRVTRNRKHEEVESTQRLQHSLYVQTESRPACD